VLVREGEAGRAGVRITLAAPAKSRVRRREAVRSTVPLTRRSLVPGRRPVTLTGEASFPLSLPSPGEAWVPRNSELS
jgi:hypothetical protein